MIRRSDGLAAVVFLGALAAVVALHVTGHADGTSAVVALAGPVLAAVYVTTAVGDRVERTRDQVSKTQDQVAKTHEAVGRVEAQTNGVLDARIREQTKQAMTELLREQNTPPPG